MPNRLAFPDPIHSPPPTAAEKKNGTFPILYENTVTFTSCEYDCCSRAGGSCLSGGLLAREEVCERAWAGGQAAHAFVAGQSICYSS